jgi:hypothetical protein
LLLNIIVGEAAVPYFKTSAVARQLGIPYYVLFDLIRHGRMEPPEKDSSGDYVWTAADVERARQAMSLRRANRRGGPTHAA